MAISNDLLSTTLYSIKDDCVDELYKRTALLDGLRSHGGIEKLSGGYKIQRPLAMFEHSNITDFSGTGYENYDLGIKDPTRAAEYAWADFGAPIIINRKEELENSGEYGVVKILEVRMKSAMNMLKRDLNRQMLVGDVATLTAMNSLNGDTAGGTGFIEPEVTGTQTNVVGGLSKATFQVSGWLNQFEDAAGTLALDQMYALANKANQVSDGGQLDHVIMSNGAWTAYRKLIFAQERFQKVDKLDGGRMSLMFNGAICESDPVMGFAMTSAGAGAGFASAYFLNYSGIKLCFHNEGDFEIRPFVDVPQNESRIARVYVKCQLVADQLGGQGLLFDAEA